MRKVCPRCGATCRGGYRADGIEPVAKPDFTWTPGNPYPIVPDAPVHDRIDFVFSAGREPRSVAAPAPKTRNRVDRAQSSRGRAMRTLSMKAWNEAM